MCAGSKYEAACALLQFLLEVARQKNQTPLPLIKPYTGPRLPPDRYCLTAPNYRLKTVQKKVKNQLLLVDTPPPPNRLSLLMTTLSLCVQVSSTAGRISVPRLSVGAVSSRPSTPTLGEQPGSESSVKNLDLHMGSSVCNSNYTGIV